MANYCTYSDVEILLGFSTSATSVPTTTQTTTLCTNRTGEIDVHLYAQGITSQPANTNVLAMLKNACMKGVAWDCGRIPNSGIDQDKAEKFGEEYKDFLKLIDEKPEIFGEITGNTTVSCGNQVTDGTYTEDEVNGAMIDPMNWKV